MHRYDNSVSGSRLRQARWHGRLACYLTLVTAALSVAGGCGPGGPAVGQVEGTVTLDGSPLPKAMIEFQPDQGAPSYGETDAQGHYALAYTVRRKGALVGHHTVRITTAGEVTDEASGETVNVPERVPPWYHLQSQLECEVEKGKNEFDFELSTTIPEEYR